MSGVLSFFNPSMGQASAQASAYTSEIARITAEVEARKKRLNSMANTLASQTSEALVALNDDALNVLTPGQAEAITVRKDTILSRRAQPGRAQTVLANEAQRYG